MSRATVEQLMPASAEEAAAALRDAGGARIAGPAAALRDATAVRIRGAGTKQGWGNPVQAAVELRTERLDALLAHHEGDLTAVLQAGVPLARAQATFAAAGQMLALDPPDGGATIGGVVATGDSGPLRHRYGAPRDLVLGVQVALPDGSVARAGSQVIKNVAGYDLAKLMSGAFGTLGVLTEVTVRLHPRPAGWCSAVGRADEPRAVAAAASALTHLPLEAEALDVRWDDGGGAVLARFGGPSAPDRADVALRALREAGLEAAAVVDDEPLWSAQRDGQRGTAVVADDEALRRAQADGQRGAAVLRISTTQDRLVTLLAAAREHGARVVARAAYGLAWLTLPEAEPEPLAATVARLRATLAPAPCVLLDAPAALRDAVDPWGPADAQQLRLMRRVKERFDPERRCNPGLFVGGI